MLYPSLILISERSNRQFIRLSLFYFTPDFLLHHHHDTVVQLAGCTVVQPGELSPRPLATLTDQHHCKYAVPTITLHLLCPDHSVSRNTPWWAFLCRVSNIRRVINCFLKVNIILEAEVVSSIKHPHKTVIFKQFLFLRTLL